MPATSCAVFAPSSVAVIGASDNPNKVGGRPIHYMTRFGYAGAIYPINPARAEIQNRRCYPSLQAIGVTPDAAIVAVAGKEAIQAVRDCADLGVALVVVMASGFAETGAAGRLLQDEMVAYAAARGTRVIGPNAQGVANFANGAVLNFSTMFMEVPPQDGPIAIISQSGAASVMPYALLREVGLGVRYLCATGNDADLGIAELCVMAARDPEIRLILVYAEALGQPALLAEAARLARARGAAMVLLKGGSSSKGAAAAASHTGAMVGHDGALDAFLRRHGIRRAHDMHELVSAAPLYLQAVPCGAGRTVVMSHSGAVGVMCADAAEQAGLPLTELAAATCEQLRAILPGFATASNPLDLTAALMGNNGMYPAVLEALGSDPDADMFLIGIPVAGPGYDVPALAGATAAFARRLQRPVAVCAPQTSVREAFAAHGLPVFRTESDAVRALRHYSSDCQPLAAPAGPSDQPAAELPPEGGVLGEADSLALLRRAGLPVVEHLLCASADEARAAFARIGAPVAVKGCAAAVPHKSEHGLVRLNLQSGDEVAAAAASCLAALEAMDCGPARVLVAPMVRAIHEFMLGVAVDPVFGPVVMMGEGGTLVEVRRDTVSLLAPFTVDEALAALRRLRIAPLFDGYRERPALDLAALARAAAALGDFAWRNRERLLSVDMNPVMALAPGKGVVAVDAVVEINEEKQA
ncbi:MAG: acetate--CoA ligase family protein [Noviherbaspirillum sp.]